MAMTVRELAQWLAEFHDQDARVDVVEVDGWGGTNERALDVDSNVDYYRHGGVKGYLTLGKA